MDQFRYDYAMIGGDLRQVYLVEELAKKGRYVCAYALCQPVKHARLDDPFTASSSLEAAISRSGRILCPIPFSKDKVNLNQSFTKKNISLKQILSLLLPGQHFFAGCIPDDFRHAALKKGVLVFDFMEDKMFSYFNTVATAEGVICEAIKESPVNLHSSSCAVLGYGKCGRTLTDRLKRLFCRVTVAALPEEELAQASPVADEVFGFPAFFARIGTYDFIFNTIPAQILTKEVLAHVRKDTVILDIASSPGGADFAAAKELSLHIKSCPGLPGKYSPLSMARAIIESVQRHKM